MTIMQWLARELRRFTQPTEAEIAARKAEREADYTDGYRQGRQDERYELLAELAAEQQAAKVIDQALKQADRKNGDVARAWHRVHKPGYNPISLVPIVEHAPFPWLPDNNQLNQEPQPIGAFEIPSPETGHELAALHELLGCYDETQKLPRVKAP